MISNNNSEDIPQSSSVSSPAQPESVTPPLSKFHESLEYTIAGQVPSDIWVDYRMLLLSSQHKGVSQLFIGDEISELTFCWGPCGRGRFNDNEILLSLEPKLLKDKLKQFSESFGPNHAEWGPEWTLSKPYEGTRTWINKQTNVKKPHCPDELKDKFYLTAHENTLPNLRKCVGSNPKPPIIICNFTLHSKNEGKHSAHANYLIFILTVQGYICFRGDPHGFNNTLEYFKPELLDEYLKIYFKENLSIKYITNKELISTKYSFPVFKIQHLENINVKCANTGFCSTWVLVILSLILKQILNLPKENIEKTLKNIGKIYNDIQKYINVDQELSPTKRKRPKETIKLLDTHFRESFDDYMIRKNLEYSSLIVTSLEYFKSIILSRRDTSSVIELKEVLQLEDDSDFDELFKSIQDNLNNKFAFTWSNQDELIDILECIKGIDPKFIDHQGINYKLIDQFFKAYGEKKYKKKLKPKKRKKKKLTKKPKKKNLTKKH